MQPTTPLELVVSALVPLQLAAAPTIARFVVVALVLEALVAKSDEKLLYLFQKFCVVVLKSTENCANEDDWV